MSRQDERMVTIAMEGGSGLALEGIYTAGRGELPGGAVVAPPHPLHGGSIASPVLSEISHACARAGLASLRFNWRGVGASAGEPSGEAAHADADYAAALAHLAESVPGPLIACGYSFGALAAARAVAGEARIESLLLVSPPASMLSEDLPGRSGIRVLIATGEHDEIAPPAALEARVGGLPGAKLAVIEAADHFFREGLPALSRILRDWL